MTKNLVIVESPSKSKTIEKYLGKDFKVVSSVGHIRDLSTSGKYGFGVDIDNNFKPDYKIIKGKAKLVNDDIELSSAGVVIDDVLYVLDSDYEDWYYIKNKKSEVLDVEDISYDVITDNVYAYSDDAVYQVNGKKLKELKGDFDEIGYISVN